MGFLNFFKEKQYEQEVQKMNGPQVFGLLDLMSPEMKKMLLSQISGIDANFPKEQQERMDKLLEEAQKLPASEKLKLLKGNFDAMKEVKEKIDSCSYLQSKWKELEEHYGKKIPENLPFSIRLSFQLGDNFTHSDLIKTAAQSDDMALMGALAYSVLLDAHNKGQKDVVYCCENRVRVDNKMGDTQDKRYQSALKALDKEKQFEERRTASQNARVKAALDGR